MDITYAPKHTLTHAEIEGYWKDLIASGRAADRFYDCDELLPTALRYTSEQPFMFFAMLGDRILGETTLNSPQGRNWQIHYSSHPSTSFKEALTWTKGITDFFLSQDHISGLYGLTPVTFKGSLILSHKIGFKRVAVLKDGVFLRGEWVDIALFYKIGY